MTEGVYSSKVKINPLGEIYLEETVRGLLPEVTITMDEESKAIIVEAFGIRLEDRQWALDYVAELLQIGVHSLVGGGAKAPSVALDGSVILDELSEEEE